jgi:uncharacterized membrane protein
MRIPTWLAFFVFLFPLAVLPLLFGEFVIHGLSKLHLSPEVALLLVFGMIATGFVNIPVRRIKREEGVPHHPLAIVGLSDIWPHLQRMRDDTVIAVNVGGCLIPAGLALYEIWHLGTLGAQALGSVTVAVIANAIVSYLIARPVPRVGIAMPSLVSPVVAAGLALLLAPDYAPPVALVGGVIGPLVGADLLHLRDVERIEAGIVSIGGAGTFDGIVLSGLVAAYLS